MKAEIDGAAVFADLRWPDQTGIGVVKREVVRRMPPHLKLTDLKVDSPIGSVMSPYAIWRALSRQNAKRGVFWSPGFVPPALCNLESVVSVHDLIHLKFYSKAHAAYYNWVLKPLYRRCSAVLCCSENTRNDFLEWSGVPEDRVHTVYLGASDDFAVDNVTGGLSFPYVFYPGNHRPYKNMLRLIRAYAASKLPANGVNLVFTGHAAEPYASEALKWGVSKAVYFLGDVPYEEMASLYKGALMLAFVSLYEGFGLPIVEAMAAGIPVLTSNVSSMPEVAGGAAYIADPRSVEDIKLGLEVLTFDVGERDRLIALGRHRAKLFTWDSTASRVWQIVESLR